MELSILNAEPRELSGPECLHHLLPTGERNQHIAISYHDFKHEPREITYAELHAKSDRLASSITAIAERHARGKHFIVPLLLPQSPNLYISQLAILKAGGAFCPLPIDAPEDRLGFILRDVQASVLLTTSGLRSRIPRSTSVTIINVDDIHHIRPGITHRFTGAHDLAYVMYTSGSTGLPKGVLLSHSAAVQALLAHDRHIPAFQRFLQFAAPTFDVSVFEIFFTLFRGQTIVCCERTRLLSDLPDAIRRCRIDAAELTPSVASNLLGPRNGVPDLRLLLTIGEMLRRDVVERYGGNAEQEAILQGMYGPTEATIHCTLQANFQTDMKITNIGIPLDTVSAFVVAPATADKLHVEILPIGTEGELAIGGYQLADGYLNRDEQTVAAFQDHPEYGRLYRTGDKAVMRDDGLIYCLGRISEGQVKLRGQRLELGEVEYAVSQTPGCTGAVAEVISDVLVVFCKCDPRALSAAELRNACKKWLPAYMIPTEFILQKDLPYLPSGKIDRRSLRTRFEASNATDGQHHTQDSDSHISELSALLRQILGPGAIRGDGLRLSGIDSLTAIRIVSALNKSGRVPPNAIQVMSVKSIHELSVILEHVKARKQVNSTSSSELLISKRREEALLHATLRRLHSDIELVLPCSAQQCAMLSLTLTQADLYCNTVQLTLKTSRDNAMIEKALATLIDQHELLRSGILPSRNGFDLVVFKARSTSQVRWVERLDPSYELRSDGDFLTTCRFQVHRRSPDAVIVLIQLHHALYDQWSIDILINNIHDLLNDRAIRTYPFSSLLKHYMEDLDASISNASLEFWRTHLKGAQPASFPNLNGLRMSHTQCSTSWKSFNVDLSRVHESIRHGRFNVQSLCQAAFVYLLSRYIGDPTIILANVLAGRHLALSNIDQIFGPAFVTLPLRITLEQDWTWLDAISTIYRLNRDIVEHSTVPLAQVKRLTEIEDDQALFDTLFVYQNSTVSPRHKDVFESGGKDRHEFKLALEMRHSDDKLQARLTHHISLIPEAQAQAFLSQLEAVLNIILTDPELSISNTDDRLPLEVRSTQNIDPQPAARDLDLALQLEKAGQLYAQHEALLIAESFDGAGHHVSMPFADMHLKANQIAQYLVHQGVKPNDLVCICLEKTIDLYVTILGIIKAGAGYLPMVPEIQLERAIAILEQANVSMVLTEKGASVNSVHIAARTQLLSEVDLDRFPKTPPSVISNPSHVAYTIFTSGSTGIPKGVTVTRQNLLGNIMVLQELYPHAPKDRLLQSCLQSFDVAVFEIFFCFASGLTICTARKDILFEDLSQSIRFFGITHLSMTPTVAGLIHPDEVPSVKFLVTAGEAITAAVHKAWAGRGLHQGYGPSETTNICTVQMDTTPQHHLGSIGRALRNTSVFVLDPQEFRILPQGAYGEFAFGGEQVFRGYLGLEELNRAKIIEHPEYGRVYRSGDMGRMLTDGSLLIHGRSDFQVKIRGNRVELGEINSVVLRSAKVEDCFTVAHRGDIDILLLSFWVPRGCTERTTQILHADEMLQCNMGLTDSLTAALPSYMLPTYLIPISSLPRTAQGKLDQRALQGQFQALRAEERAQFARQHEANDEVIEERVTEKDIKSNLASLLRCDVEQVDRMAQFDALGLNSVSAISFARSLTQQLRRRVTVAAIMRNGSVAQLARALDVVESTPQSGSAGLIVFESSVIKHMLASLSIGSDQVEAVLPCTPLQEAMLAMSTGMGSQYTNTTTFKIAGDVDKLKATLQRSIERHAILRTVFVDSNTREHPFAQVVLRTASLPWTNGIDRVETVRPSHPVNPAHPLKFVLRNEGGISYLDMHMHHAIYDGASMAILLAEIEALYNDQMLPPAPNATDFIAECMRQKGSVAQEFWSSSIAGFQPHPLPTSKSAVDIPEVYTSHDLKPSLTDLERHAVNSKTSIASILHTAWTKALAILQDTPDVCVGDVVSGRDVNVHAIDALVAPCFNTVPLRINLGRSKTNQQLLQQVHRTRKMSQPYQLTPLRLVQRRSDSPEMTLFDSILIVQPPADERDGSIWTLIGDEGGMGLPLALEIFLEQRPRLTVHYTPGLIQCFDPRVVLGVFDSCLEDILNKSDELIAGNDGDIAPLRGSLRSHCRKKESEPQQTLSNGDLSWSESERAVRTILSSLANVTEERITHDTTIYQLGLDSLNAAQIATQLRAQGYLIDMADVLEQRTPAAIARTMVAKPSSGCEEDAHHFSDFEELHKSHVLTQLRGDEHEIESIRPCTAVQQGMLVQSIASKGGLYVNHVWLDMSGKYNAEQIDQAWSVVCTKHPMLRAAFIQSQAPEAPFILVLRRSPGMTKKATCSHQSIDEDAIAAQIIEDLTRSSWRLTLTEIDDSPILVVSLHHALYDAGSLHYLLRDFEAALSEIAIGPHYSIDTVLRSAMQNAKLNKTEKEQFWRNALSTAAGHPFPSLTCTTIKQSRLLEYTHSSSLSSDRLEAACRERGCTVQSALQTAWAILLRSYLGERNVTFGTVFSSRVATEGDDIVFPCINTVPIHVNESTGDEALLAHMVDHNAALQRHLYAPLSEIQKLVGRSGETLFDTVVVYQQSSNIQLSLLSIRRQSAAVDYKLSLELEKTPSGSVQLRLSYADSILSTAHAELMTCQFEQILQHVLSGNEPSMPSLGLVSILRPRQYSIDSSLTLLHHTVEQNAMKTPDNPALEFISGLDDKVMRQVWTYRELDIIGNRIAHLIGKYNVKPSHTVAVCMQKCPEASFLFLGILKAGCAFLAMDPELPRDRKRYILEDSSASIFFTDYDITEEDFTSGTLCIRFDLDMLNGLPSNAPGIDLDTQATCYCLYTSGTTGTPKGCEISHESAVQAMLAFQRLFASHWTEHSRWLQFASYWFDVSVLEHFWSWSVGITMVGAPRDLVLGYLVEFINKAHITHIDLTPSLARILDPEDVPTMHSGVFITGGEALKQEIIERWGKYNVICNGYGPTEATIGVTMNTFISPDAKPANIGPPFDNVGAVVVDPDTLNPVLIGAIGELCVFGKLVGKGYLNRPDQTQTAFPTLTCIGERVYRTGDLVRQTAEGSFLFVGRKDSQAKLRGQRLEIDEIDSRVRAASPDITDVASLIVKSETGDKQTLVSLITTVKVDRSVAFDLDINTRTTRVVKQAIVSCRKFLPGYMVPTHILPVTRIPLTVNNKIDAKTISSFYKSLSPLTLQTIQQASHGGKPFDDRGRKVGQILARMLSINFEDITLSSNIFSLGLSSVSAISFVSLLKQQGFEKASVARVMKHAHLDDLIASLSDDKDKKDDSTVRQAQLSLFAFDQRYRRLAAKQLGVQLAAIEKVTPCTPLQQGLIFESNRSAHQPYFNTFRFKLGDLDEKRLVAALQTLMDNVEVLRAKYIPTDDGFFQAILSKGSLCVEKIHCTEQESEAVIEKSVEAWREVNKDSLILPFKVQLLRTRSCTIMAIHIHHALYDGISFDRLMVVLSQVYDNSRPDYGPSFTSALASGPLRKDDNAKAFWTEHMNNVQYSSIPARPGHQNSATFSVQERLHYDDLEMTRRKLGVSHQSLFQAAFEVALLQLFGSLSTYGVVVGGRSISIEGADRVLGPLFNSLPCAVAARGTATWTELVKDCQVWNTAVVQYQHTALRDIKKWCGKTSGDTLFETLFVFQAKGDAADDTGNLWVALDDDLYAEYPLAVEVELVSDSTVQLILVSQASAAGESDLSTFVNNFDTAVRAMIKDSTVEIAATFEFDRHQDHPSTPKKSGTDNVNGVHNFQWTSAAKSIRDELARLAGLDIDQVDEHNTVYQLGLDSIDVVKLVSRLRKKHIDLKVSTVLSAQTIPRMLRQMRTETIHEGMRSSQVLQTMIENLTTKFAIPSGLRHTVERMLPATPGQEALLVPMLRSDFKDYFNHDLLKLHSNTEASRLEAAWQTVLSGSPILRTSFSAIAIPGVDCAFVQIVHRAAPHKVRRSTLEHLSQTQGLMEEIRKDVAATFETLPPIRLTFVTIMEEKYLLLSLAHAQYDGHSLALIHEDVARAYNGSYEFRPTADDIINDALLATGSGSIEFWNEALADNQLSSLAVLNQNGDPGMLHRYERVSNFSTSEVRKLCQELGVSLQTVAQTCWSLILASYSSQLEVMFSVVLACRDSLEAEQVMFPTFNTVLFRTALFGSRKDVLMAVQDFSNDLQPHKQTPLRLIKSAYRKQNGEQIGKNTETMFIFQQRPTTEHSAAHPLYASVQASSSVDYAVAAEVEVDGDTIILRAAIKDNVMSSQQTQTLVKHMEVVLEGLLYHSDEHTVHFEDEYVSICGLPSFKLQASGNDAQRVCTDGVNVESAEDLDGIDSILAQMAGVDISEVTPSASLESLGIDSISAIKLSSRLKQSGKAIKVRDLLRAKSVAEVAKFARQMPSETPEITNQHDENMLTFADLAPDGDIGEQDVELILPALAGQVYVLSVWKNTRGRLFYPTFTYNLIGDVQASALEDAWQGLSRIHPILRTTFASTTNKTHPVAQVVLKEVQGSITFGTASLQRDDQPMVHLSAQQTASGYILKLHIHHALYDAISLPAMIHDLEQLLRGKDISTNSVSLARLVSLASSEQARTSNRHFWTTYLSGMQQHRLHILEERSSERVEIYEPKIIADIAGLKQKAREKDLNIQSLVFAGWAKVLAETAPPDQPDIVLGIYLSNRSHFDSLVEMRAPTLNLVPLRVRDAYKTPLLELAKQIQGDLAEINEAERSLVTLWEIAEWTGVTVDTFLNFVQLPERSDSAQQEEPIQVHSQDTNLEDERNDLVEVEENEDFMLPQGLRQLPDWPGVYNDSLDIEMTIAHGSLDVGIFALSSVVSIEEAQDMLWFLERQLSAALE